MQLQLSWRLLAAIALALVCASTFVGGSRVQATDARVKINEVVR